MTRIFAGLMVAVLAACATETVIVPDEVYRDTSAQIASQTDVTADRMAGDWVVRQRFAAPLHPRTDVSIEALVDGALQMTTTQIFCRADLCEAERIPVRFEQTGIGRWSPVGPQSVFSDTELWVMWMDFDSRTAAIGTPSGEFGWIMDKSTSGGGDRITAAREIMDWFGYDLARLQDIPR